jgi:hypothetical protein
MTPADIPDDAPRLAPRTLWLLALIAVAVRAAYVLVSTRLRGISISDYAFYGDGWEVVAYARWIAGQGPVPPVGATRFLPGLPATLALFLRAGIPLTLASLAFQWLCAALFTTATAALYRDWRVGLATALLIPDVLLITGGLNSTEAPMLAFATLGVLCAVRGRPVPAGVLLGLAGAYRPMACFAVLGYFCYAASRRQWGRAAIVAVLSAGVVGIAVLGMKLLFGDPLRAARVYATTPAGFNGRMFEWPLKSLLFTPFYYPVRPAKIVLVWAHVVVLFVACGLLIRRAASADRRAPLDLLSLPWLLGNTLFVLCIGGIWGFQGLPRYIAAGVPPMFDALRQWLPRRWGWWAVLGGASFVVAVAIFVKRGELPV